MIRSLSFFRQFCSKAHSVRLTGDSRKLELLAEGEEKRRAYHGVWLRHNCKCPECYSALTNTTKLHITDVYHCKEIKSARINGGNVLVHWTNTEHEGLYPLHWLVRNDYSNEENRRERHGKQQPSLIAETLPVTDFNDIVSSDEGFYRLLKNLSDYGVSLINGISEPQNASQKLASRFPNLLYGEIYAVIHKEVFNDVAFDNCELPLHQDLLYYENPPGIQLFNCVRNDPCVEGGESTLLDLYPIVAHLQRDHPERFHTLATTPISFAGKTFNGDDDLRMTRHHIELDRFGQVCAINWNQAHSEQLCVNEEDTERYYDAVYTMARLVEESKLRLSHRLVPGECLILNNRRVAHGRLKFEPNGGVRHLDGFYVHTDYLRSEFVSLGEKLSKEKSFTNLFMHSV